jgi:hypothetical protein
MQLGWLTHRPALAAGLALFLAGTVASRAVTIGILDGLSSEQKLRLLDTPRRGGAWLLAFGLAAALALWQPQLGILAMCGYFFAASLVRLRWLSRQSLPDRFMARARASAALLSLSFLILAIAVQF